MKLTPYTRLGQPFPRARTHGSPLSTYVTVKQEKQAKDRARSSAKYILTRTRTYTYSNMLKNCANT